MAVKLKAHTPIPEFCKSVARLRFGNYNSKGGDTHAIHITDESGHIGWFFALEDSDFISGERSAACCSVTVNANWLDEDVASRIYAILLDDFGYSFSYTVLPGKSSSWDKRVYGWYVSLNMGEELEKDDSSSWLYANLKLLRDSGAI